MAQLASCATWALAPLADTGGRPPAPGQQVAVRGQVFDDQDKSPVAGARVMTDSL